MLMHRNTVCRISKTNRFYIIDLCFQVSRQSPKFSTPLLHKQAKSVNSTPPKHLYLTSLLVYKVAIKRANRLGR